jgi:hypothetical protein
MYIRIIICTYEYKLLNVYKYLIGMLLGLAGVVGLIDMMKVMEIDTLFHMHMYD